MEKINLKKELKYLYQPSAKEVVQVDVPAMNYLMIDGEGDPNTSLAYADAVEALFAVSYAIKFMVKKGSSAIDYGVMPLEGLWWADDMSKFTTEDKSNWKWTMMIMQPSFVTPEIIDSAIANVKKKKNPTALSKLRLEAFSEGRRAQILHIGPFSEEGPTIEKVHQFIDSRGNRTGKHHEIYLSDIRKADPAKWKTIIRQPMQ
ncbi:GyrI-like domain-containing protein [Methylophaga sp.]|uniref:GyrI-like domain-containing protein n=1 Tax=Methylophaga sp. TaxID=2024840 RepID=UPI0027266B08|nr:GyrI-like domain-containing protein [Methylophaga sp.]MDO8827840.1 GyrI-like domain-containing protein [Methylophaga sp.]